MLIWNDKNEIIQSLVRRNKQLNLQRNLTDIRKNCVNRFLRKFCWVYIIYIKALCKVQEINSKQT